MERLSIKKDFAGVGSFFESENGTDAVNLIQHILVKITGIAISEPVDTVSKGYENGIFLEVQFQQQPSRHQPPGRFSH